MPKVVSSERAMTSSRFMANVGVDRHAKIRCFATTGVTMKRGSGASFAHFKARALVKPPLFTGFGVSVLGASGLHIFKRELKWRFVQRCIADGQSGEVDNPSI
jgi:hypothetical protein